MPYVHYVGTADRRIWNGYEWSGGNGWSVDQALFDAGQLTVLRANSGFLTDQTAPIRPGSTGAPLNGDNNSGLSQTVADKLYVSTSRSSNLAAVYGAGDSNMAQSVSSQYGGSILDGSLQLGGNSIAARAILLGNGRWRWAGQAATPSFSAAQIRDQMIPNIVAVAPKGSTVVVLAGTNGHVLADIIGCYQAVLDAGLRLVACTIPPSSAASITATTTVNEGIRSWCALRGIQIADIYAAVVDPATGAYQSAFNGGDGIHPNDLGRNEFSKVIADALNRQYTHPVRYLAELDAVDSVAAYLFKSPLLLHSILDTTPWPYYGYLSAMGTSTQARTTDPNVLGKMLTHTVGDTNVNGVMAVGTVLVPGSRIRMGFALKANTAPAGGSVNIRLENESTGSTWLWAPIALGANDSVALCRIFTEMTVPAGLPAGNYRIRISATGTGTTVSIGEITIRTL